MNKKTLYFVKVDVSRFAGSPRPYMTVEVVVELTDSYVRKMNAEFETASAGRRSMIFWSLANDVADRFVRWHYQTDGRVVTKSDIARPVIESEQALPNSRAYTLPSGEKVWLIRKTDV